MNEYLKTLEKNIRLIRGDIDIIAWFLLFLMITGFVSCHHLASIDKALQQHVTQAAGQPPEN